MKNNELERGFKFNIKKVNTMYEFYKKGIFLATIILFSISLAINPSNAYAEEINVESVGIDKTTIITLTNDASKELKTFRIWLSPNDNFESFKTEKGWIGEKNKQGVIIFSSSESIKENQSVKFGIKTDKPNPVINWKGLDKTNIELDTGVIITTKIKEFSQNPTINLNEENMNSEGKIFSDSTFRIIPDKPNPGSTIRVTGQNFEASQSFDFYIDTKKIGNFDTDNRGNFITTMKIPEKGIQDRVDFKIKNNQGEEKILSLRIGNNENRIAESIDVKIETNGIEKINYRGDNLQLFGTAIPNQLIDLMLEDNFGNEIISDIIQVDETGFIEFEYQTTENDDEEGTWTLVATQNENKEFIYVGYGEVPTIPVNLEFNKMNYKTSEKAIISVIGKPSDVLKMIIINPSGNISGEETLIELREDGRETYELDLAGYGSGIYTAVIQKDNSQSSEKFSVGLQLGSGPIEVKTTRTEYNQGERILLLGSTNANSLLNVILIDPKGIEMKVMEVPSKSDGTFTVNEFKIPSNGILGTWKINVNSGSNFESVEFNVISEKGQGLTITVEDNIVIPGFGKTLKFSITTEQKTSISMKIFDMNKEQVGTSSNCVPTADFKCEILWTIPKDAIPGTYTASVTDSITTKEATFEIK